jgi:hypothetical protein
MRYFLLYFLSILNIELCAQRYLDSCWQISLESAVVIPISYRYNVSVESYSGDFQANVKADFKPTFNLACKFKTKGDNLIKLLFQSDEISFKGPVEENRTGYRSGNTSYFFYEGVTYTQYRLMFAMGKKIALNKKHSFFFSYGLSGFFGDSQYRTSYNCTIYQLKTVPPSNNWNTLFPSSWGGQASYGFFVAPNFETGYSYRILNFLDFEASINATLWSFRNEKTIGDFSYKTISMFSANIGVKYNIITKKAKFK